MIKQYLNDSEFVEIQRKNNSLDNGEVKYGKSIIKYTEENKYKQKKQDRNNMRNSSKSAYYNNDNSQYPIFSRAYYKLWQILSLGILNKKR